MRSLLAALLLLPGCALISQDEYDEIMGLFDDTAQPRLWYRDADGDDFGVETDTREDAQQPEGFAAVAGDCDDGDPAVHPDATETCTTTYDDDCDGETDEADAADKIDWYMDYDSDGYGDAERVTQGCEAPSGYVATGDDCDDTEAEVFPGANETCNGIDDDCDQAIDEPDATDAGTWYDDSDGDGWGNDETAQQACAQPTNTVEVGGDCNDGDDAVNPEATELCDGVDNDCDGTADNDDAADASTWYADSDGDSYGDVDSTTTACSQPSGYVSDTTDCDDSDSAVNPSATELCNEVDDDCDGATDEDDAVDASTWYADTDSDSYGDASSTTTACSQPSGYVSDSTDCDDGDAAVNSAGVEVCDGVDNDCDGTADNDDASDASIWYADSDSDSYGDASSTTTACSQPSGYVADDTDCDDGDASTYPGAAEYCDSADNDCDGTTDEDDAADAPTWYADSDGDGHGDAGSTTATCSQPSGYVADDTDCDDSAAAVNPGSTETCDGVDNDCDGDTDEDDAADASTWYADSDGDSYGDAGSTTAACSQPSGYVVDATDCDDGNASAHPGATEHCDGVDNDCDGTTDEDEATEATTWYADSDGDGYGDGGSTTAACSMPSGYSGYNTDCDDSDATVNPVATEYCDGVDNDCDGTIDEDDAVDASTWCADGDGDGYGDSRSTTTACSQPSGYVVDATDCDDGDASAYPGATEVCDGLDNDCDGTADNDDATDASTWYADSDSDSFGDPANTTTACEQPSGYSDDATDCDDSDSDVNPGATELCNSVDDDCDGDTDEDPTDGRTWYADGDGDGFGDASHSQDACDVPSGYVSNNTDCDDADAAINPGAEERCGGGDDDCDGLTDDDDPGLVDGSTWYADTDGDGFGDATDSQDSCTEPSGYVSVATDCDDTDGSINPGATDYCDGVDNDCDGTTDSASTAAFVSSTGTTTSVTSSLTSSHAYTISSDGTLYICAGSYFADIYVNTPSASIVGVEGSGSTTIRADMNSTISVSSSVTSLDVTGLTLSLGWCMTYGGAINGGSTGIALTVTDCVFTENQADYGAGIYAANGSVTLTDVEFDSNLTYYDGGGLYLENCDVSMEGVTFDGNESDDYGGGAYLESCDVIITDSSFENNVAFFHGGGGLALVDSDAVIESTYVQYNSTPNHGGGLYVSGGQVELSSSLVYGNSAYGGSSYASGAGAFLTNGADLVCTDSTGGTEGLLANDAGSGVGGAVTLFDSSSTIVSTSCDWGTSGTGGDNTPDDIYLYTLSTSADYNGTASFTCTASGCL